MSHEPTEPFELSPLEEFDGVARLFPLPNVVLFPNVLLPLHIFEPRYRQMVADALAGDRLITMVMLKPGYDEDYQGDPPIYEVGSIGRIIRHEELPDGRSNLILYGLRRVQIEHELPSDRLYRTASVMFLEDCYPAENSGELADRHQRARDLLAEILTLVGRCADAERLASSESTPLGRLCDIAAHSLSFDISAKQALLEELDVSKRSETLLAWMEALVQLYRKRLGPGSEPSPFSNN